MPNYIGARYVPAWFTNPNDSSNNWVTGISYEPLTMVTYNGAVYISKVPVPATIGAPDTAPEYWFLINIRDFFSVGRRLKNVSLDFNSADITAGVYYINQADTTLTWVNGPYSVEAGRLMVFPSYNDARPFQVLIGASAIAWRLKTGDNAWSTWVGVFGTHP